MCGVENSLQPAIVLHAVGQTTPDNADSIFLFESEGGGRGLRGCNAKKGSAGGNPNGE